MRTRASIRIITGGSILITRSRDTCKTENFRRESDGNLKIKNDFRYLGSFIGEKGEIEWVEEKNTNGIKTVESVAELIKYASQSAYTGIQRAPSARVDFYPTGGSEYWYFVQ